MEPEKSEKMDTQQASKTAGKGETKEIKLWDTDVGRTVEVLRQGTDMMKVRSRFGSYRRHFLVNPDEACVSYNNSKKTRFNGVWRKMSCASAPSQAKLYMTEIQEVREGAKTDTFRKVFRALQPQDELCFSLVLGDEDRTLDLVAPDMATKKQWVDGLRYMMDLSSPGARQKMWLKQVFTEADKNHDKALSFPEIIQLMLTLNVHVDSAQAFHKFKISNVRRSTDRSEEVLDIDEFMEFYKLMTDRKDIRELFLKYSHNKEYLTKADIMQFFDKEQHTTCSEEDCDKIIAENELCPELKQESRLSYAGFSQMFYTPRMDVFNPAHRSVYQDMEQPLSHYFIESSHNTYLAGDQIAGPCAVESYVKALKSGCRSVELDVWDGPDNEPVIYHGYTPTKMSKLLLKNVLQDINTYAFTKSPYPVILSIENHCSVKQQDVMASYFKDIFGSKLLTKLSVEFPKLDIDVKLGLDALKPKDVLPSPASLKNKIIIKGKKLKKSDDCVSDEDEAADMQSEDVKRELARVKAEEVKHKLSSKLSDCVVICKSVSFKTFEESKNKYSCKYISSFSEIDAQTLCEEKAEEFVKHNTWQLSRIYPSGARIDSSNFDPMQLWTCGCQIVALNYQTQSEPMFFNKGLFDDNGGCGYVLKPQYLREPTNDSADTKKTLKMKIISGFQLPKKPGDAVTSILDPYVRIDVYDGSTPETEMLTDKTSVCRDNGFDPSWNHQMEFNVNRPQMALVLIRVFDERHEERPVAQYCLSFRCLQQGYRTVNLKTPKQLKTASLLVHISIT